MRIHIPFLTKLDTRAAIKGSRDPLGVQAIWTRLGRTVVGNLTTVSNQLRDFKVTLLGYYIAERVAEDSGNADDLGVFIRWEQLASYARFGINGERGFRGTERVSNRWTAESDLTLGLDSQSLILSDQKTYGLWGLYTVPSRSSAMLAGSPTRLSPAARRFVEEVYLPTLDGRRGARAEDFAKLLKDPRIDFRPRGRHKPLLERVAKTLKARTLAREVEFLREHLVLGGPTDSTLGAQGVLARALERTHGIEDWGLSPATMRDLSKWCRSSGGEKGDAAADHLDRIAAAESVLAPAASLFGFVLASRDQTLDSLVREVRSEWPARLSGVRIEELRANKTDLVDASRNPASAERWCGIAELLSSGSYGEAIERLIEQNGAVMNQRGGTAPWVELSRGRVKVKLAVETAVLPDRGSMDQHWVHPYFIGSLRDIQLQLGA